MKTFLKFAALTAVALGVAAFAGPSTAQAQVVVTGYAPAVSYYRPRPILRPFTYAPAVTAVPTTTYYAPAATTAYYAPATTSYYAPAATTSYYAPSTPTTTYYAPSVTAPTTTYYAPSAPVTTYYAPSVAAPVTTYYAPSVLTPPVVPAW